VQISADGNEVDICVHPPSSAAYLLFVLAAVAQDTPAPSAEERPRIVEQSREIALA
jgi:hypothetical protein